MTDTRIDFTDVQWTQLVTLYHRALDARSPTPILGDHEAVAAVERVDYDFDQPRMRVTSGDRTFVVLRAQMLDEWATAYLERHPDTTVVSLGCGLDSRAFRLSRPPGSRWFDVDLPDVIALRRRLYTDDEGYRMIGCSVTDPSWLDEIPTEGPVLVIAEGLLMYLDPGDVATLLHRLRSRFASGRLLADGIAPWAVRLTRWLPGPFRAFGMHWAVPDASEFSRLDAAYRVVSATPVLSRFARIPQRGRRWLFRALNTVPGLRAVAIITAVDFGG